MNTANRAFVLLLAAGALCAFQTPYDNWLNQEVTWIISPDERAAFERLRTDDERQMFIVQFWLRRDPTPGTPLNELREEHYRRIAYSNDRYAFGATPGWQSDRGAAYIKFGPPDEKEEHRNDSPRTERWRYRFVEGRGANVILEFVDAADDDRYSSK